MVTKNKNALIIGPHVSIAGGFQNSIELAEMVGATAFQIFSKSNRSWFAPKIDAQEAETFKTALKSSSIEFVLVHACYLINLASSSELVVENSRKSLAKEMERCAQLGIKNLVFHPGAHTGSGLQAGIERIWQGLNKILEKDETGTNLLIETMAGQGSTIGSKFQELAQIRENITKKNRVFFCLDTCHVFAAGYDLVDHANFGQTVKMLDSVLGLENVHAIHLNDSMLGCGQRKDRHANLGTGKIGNAGLSNILTDPKLSKIPMILETPIVHGFQHYAKEILLAKKLASQA